MRRRLYFMLPDIRTAEIIEKELLLAHVDDRHMHFLATFNTDLGALRKANILQRTDLLHGMFVGLIVGGLTGAVLGYLLYMYPEFGGSLGMGLILGLALAGAIFGSWASGMIAISTPNTRLKSFQKAIDQGQILVMVDVPKERVAEIMELINSHHPEVDNKGVEAHIPAFP